MHGRLDLPEHARVMNGFPSVPLVSISDAQRTPVPDAGWVRTIHHGLPAQSLTPLPRKPSYLAVLGRISPEKGMDRAIRIGEKCGLPVKIAAKIDRVDVQYFQETIRPLLNPPHAEHIGEIGDADKSEFLSGAYALLAPLDWPEPFGLVLIEAMACGTPVIAFNRGSVPEVVEDGLTGFVVSDEAGALAAIERLPQLSRVAIRRRFEQRFTARRMADDYLSVYAELMEAAMPRPKLVRVSGGKS
jgi:glycosyltransferase involved in cell wall biosynthesis